MNRRLIIIFVFILLLIVATTFTVAQTPTEDVTPTPEWNVVTAQDVFLRGGPGEEYLPVGALQVGDQITPVNRNADATWILIRYRRGFGWIRWDLAYWVVTLNALPILDEDNLTPSPPPGLETATPFFPTSTPSGNYINLSGANSAFVRAGPGVTYLRLGQLLAGDEVEPVGRNETAGWIMIRFEPPPSADVLGAEFNFGWIQRNLVIWLDEDLLDDLPVLSEDDLTPTITFTPSQTLTHTLIPTITYTATLTATPTITPSPTQTPTLTSTSTATITPSLTLTVTPLPTLTDTITPSLILTTTHTPIPSSTILPTETHTLTAISTATYTDVPTETIVDTTIPTETAVPTETDTLTSTYTETLVPSTATSSPIPPTETATEAESVAVIVTEEDTPTETVIPTETDTLTSTYTETLVPSTATSSPIPPTETATETESVAVSVTEEDTPTESVPSETPPQDTATPEVTESVVSIATDIPATPALADVIIDESGDSNDFPTEAIVAGAVVLFILIYVVFYLRGSMLTDRYSSGFVIESCPVCQRGHLTVEARVERVFGVPRPRRTIRCDACRSVLRQTGDRWWRYAVDPLENPAMFDRFNNREIDDSTLTLLGREPIHPESSRPVQHPDFVDDDDNS